MRAARAAALVAVPLVVVFAGPAVLGYGWARVVAGGLAIFAAVYLAAGADS